MFSRYLQNRGKVQSYMALQVRRKEHKAGQSRQAPTSSNSSGGRVQIERETDLDGVIMTVSRSEEEYRRFGKAERSDIVSCILQ